MALDFYAVSCQPNMVVATEINPAEVAVLFDAGHSVLLTTPTDLVRLALRCGKPLRIFSREDVLYRCRVRPASKTCRRRAKCV